MSDTLEDKIDTRELAQVVTSAAFCAAIDSLRPGAIPSEQTKAMNLATLKIAGSFAVLRATDGDDAVDALLTEALQIYHNEVPALVAQELESVLRVLGMKFDEEALEQMPRHKENER